MSRISLETARSQWVELMNSPTTSAEELVRHPYSQHLLAYAELVGATPPGVLPPAPAKTVSVG